MNIKDLDRDKIIFEAIAGSHAYGLNNEHSDIDLRGIFVMPPEHHLGLKQPIEQVSDSTNDTTYYELKRFIKLAADCNPNIIELLHMPEDVIKVNEPLMQTLIANRHLFLSKRAFHSFSGYAHAQISKAKGRNKWVNNPWGEEPPNQMDYMYWVPKGRLNYYESAGPEAYCVKCKIHTAMVNENQVAMKNGRPAVKGNCSICSTSVYKILPLNQDYTPGVEFAMRPRKLESTAGFKVAKVEHGFNCYRMYKVEGEDFFKGNQITCKSISKEEEANFAGLVLFNDTGYTADKKNWKGYWEWKRNRNEKRWLSQEAGEMDYDAKNMMHCFRMLMSTKSILENHAPLVRVEGKDKEFLMGIRNGQFEYDDLMERMETMKAELDDQKKESKLQEKVDMDAINKLYMELINGYVEPQR